MQGIVPKNKSENRPDVEFGFKFKEIDLKGLIIIVGNYGSGKTETAVNLAFNRRAAGVHVSMADLDLVNPYFRTREARQILFEKGIKVVLPEEKYMSADLPILAPQVAGLIRNPTELTILDAGGDDVGSIVLSALADSLKDKQINLIQVVNPLRPFTDTVEGCMRIQEQIEYSSKLKITGLVSNANLMDETTPDIIYKGYDLIQELSEKTGIGVEFITAHEKFLPELDSSRFKIPVLPILRWLVPPWKRQGS